MHLLIYFLLCFVLCVNCSSVSPNSDVNNDHVDEQRDRNDRLEPNQGVLFSDLPELKSPELDAIVKILNRNLESRTQKMHEEYKKEIRDLKETVKKQTVYIDDIEKKLSEQTMTVFELREELDLLKDIIPTNWNSPTKDTQSYPTNATGEPQSPSNEQHERSMVLDRSRTYSQKKHMRISRTTHRIANSNIKAFYAYMSANTPAISIQHPLVFDVVKTNIGNGYHPSTGVFIVPETGVYVFTWTIRQYVDRHHSAQLMVNTQEVGIVHNRPDSADVAVTGVVVTHVDAGDDVYVRTHAYHNSGSINSDEAGRSSFAGWKLV